jgi:hypothetical protein
MKYGGMTVNERLFVSGLDSEFQAAIGRGDTTRFIEILKTVELNDETIEALLRKYGMKLVEKDGNQS